MDDISREQLQDAINNQVWSESDTPVPEAEPTPAPEVETPKEEQPTAEPTPEAPKKSSFAKLLSERNSARKDAEETAQALSEKEQALQEALSKIKELEGKEVGEEEARTHDLELVDAISKKNTLENDLANSKKEQNKQFYKDMPEAVEIKDKIDDIMSKHPSLTQYEAFALYVGNLWEQVEPEAKPDEQLENQKKDYDLLGSPSAWSNKSWDTSSMSDQEMKAALQKAVMSGDLAL